MPTKLSHKKLWEKMIARAWADPEYKKMLETNPQAAAHKMGYNGKVGKVPPKPRGIGEKEILDEVRQKSGGASGSCGFTCCC